MSISNESRVLLNDENSYTWLQLIEMENAGIKLMGYAVTPSGLIVETKLKTVHIDNYSSLLEIQLSTKEWIHCTKDQIFYLDIDIPVQACELRVLHRPLIQFGGEIEITAINPVSACNDSYTLTSEKYGNYVLGCGILVKSD